MVGNLLLGSLLVSQISTQSTRRLVCWGSACVTSQWIYHMTLLSFLQLLIVCASSSWALVWSRVWTSSQKSTLTVVLHCIWGIKALLCFSPGTLKLSLFWVVVVVLGVLSVWNWCCCVASATSELIRLQILRLCRHFRPSEMWSFILWLKSWCQAADTLQCLAWCRGRLQQWLFWAVVACSASSKWQMCFICRWHRWPWGKWNAGDGQSLGQTTRGNRGGIWALNKSLNGLGLSD